VDGSSAATVALPALIAKGALRRLAIARLEPTPDNFARAYAEEAGQPPPAVADKADTADKALGPAWAALIERVARGLERGGRQWTLARKKESLQRVLDGSRTDLNKLQQRLQPLLTAWEGDQPLRAVDESPADGEAQNDPGSEPTDPPETAAAAAPVDPAANGGPPLVAELERTVRAALPADDPRGRELADRLAALAGRVVAEGATAPLVAAVAEVCTLARRLFGHRHHLTEELARLCQELGAGLTELAEDESWAQGQAASLRARLAEGISVRSVKATAEMLSEARCRQHLVRDERNAARDALKALIQQLLGELGSLGEQTGRYHDSVGRHAEAISRADTLQGLASVVREMVEESRAVQTLVSQTHQRLLSQHARAGELESRVRDLEADLRRLSEEVTTDALTQVANRRGLALAFEKECAVQQRDGDPSAPLAIGLIDIDNFKKLNDTLGHRAGDHALKALAGAVREQLRPADQLARFGGEEFVVLLPATPLAEAQQVLTRLQRTLTASLFMHDDREVFVTFSAGVTAWRPGEALEQALERADEALYEAKRTGKNRTCMA
jgi:diguanylate cyclase